MMATTATMMMMMMLLLVVVVVQQILIRHRAVRKDKHGGVQQKRMLMQHRTVKKDEQLGVQRIPDADTASCRQKSQKCCCNIGLLRHRAYLQSTDTTKHRMHQRQQNKNKGFQ